MHRVRGLKTVSDMRKHMPEVGLELHSSPRQHWELQKIWPIRASPTDVRPSPKPRVCTMCTHPLLPKYCRIRSRRYLVSIRTFLSQNACHPGSRPDHAPESREDVPDALFGVTEEDLGVVREEQRVLHAGIARCHRASEHHDVLGYPDTPHSHSGNGAGRVFCGRRVDGAPMLRTTEVPSRSSLISSISRTMP
ncbi:hypothetical protein QFZ40_002178 [Arthrobacter pascens]|nr:hypothetical protein [Arthrobacter pascens]